MLQYGDIDALVIPDILRESRVGSDMPTLESAVNEALATLRHKRRDLARQMRGVTRLRQWLDEQIYTSAPEYLDDAELDPRRRVAIVQSLHRFNRLAWAYRRFFSVLKPYLLNIGQRQGRPPRILELACGSGEFSLAMARLAESSGLSVHVTGSDYFNEHVEACRQKARDRRQDVDFIELNAFDMQGIPAKSFDLIFIAQSLHHFSPGQVAMMMNQSMQIAESGFVGIDGYRSLALFGIVPLVGALMAAPDFVHDSVISLRKFYTQSELELIARMACPKSFVQVRSVLPGYSVVSVLR